MDSLADKWPELYTFGNILSWKSRNAEFGKDRVNPSTVPMLRQAQGEFGVTGFAISENLRVAQPSYTSKGGHCNLFFWFIDLRKGLCVERSYSYSQRLKSFSSLVFKVFKSTGFKI